MRRGIVVTVWTLTVLSAGAAALLAAAAWPKAPAQPAVAPAFPADLLPVGGVVEVGIDGADVTARVLEAPRGNWVRVEVEEGGRPRAVWLNLDRVQWVDPAPPPKAAGRCRPADEL